MAHAQDFTEAGGSGLDLLPPVLSKRLHPRGNGCRLQGPCGHALLDQVSDRLGHSKDLEDARPSGESRVPTLGATDRLVDLVDFTAVFGKACLLQQRGLDRYRPSAAQTKDPDQSNGQDRTVPFGLGQSSEENLRQKEPRVVLLGFPFAKMRGCGIIPT